MPPTQLMGCSACVEHMEFSSASGLPELRFTPAEVHAVAPGHWGIAGGIGDSFDVDTPRRKSKSEVEIGECGCRFESGFGIRIHQGRARRAISRHELMAIELSKPSSRAHCRLPADTAHSPSRAGAPRCPGSREWDRAVNSTCPPLGRALVRVVESEVSFMCTGCT
jgi:hypothetical protein